MQLIEENNFYFELKPENLEDLWLLTQIISTGDIIYSTTKRKVALGDDKKKQVTKIISVELVVKKIFFESQVLRVTGEIQNETQYTAIGQSHTLTFTPGNNIKLQKSQLLNVEKQYLDKALTSKASINLLVLLDKDEIIAVEFGDFSFSVVIKEDGLGSKKYKHSEINEEEEKYNILKELLKKDYNNIILMGPAHFKDKLKEFIKEKTGISCLTTQWSDISSSAVEQAIAHITKTGLIESSQLSREKESLQELLYNIEKGEKASYGLKQTKEKCDLGAVEKLLLTTKFIEQQREENTYDNINEMMKQIEQLNGSIEIINSKHVPGNQLDGLGGIGAILRY